MTRRRITVTLHDAQVERIREAVSEGGDESISAFVARAIEVRLAQDAKLAELARFVAEYEAGHGEITAEEMAEQERRDDASSAAVFARLRQAG